MGIHIAELLLIIQLIRSFKKIQVVLIAILQTVKLYIFIIVRIVAIAQKAPDREGSYLAGGIAAVIAVQTLINVAVVTGSIPPTGVPLPFVSAGSSSLIAFCAAIGMVLNIKRQSVSLR